MYVVLAIALFFVFSRVYKSSEPFMYTQQTLSGSNFPSSITVDGVNVAPLRIMKEDIPLPWYNVDPSGAEYASLNVASGASNDADHAGIASGQPMPISVQPSSVLYSVNLPPITSRTLAVPTTYKSQFGTTASSNLIGVNAHQVPIESDKSFNPVHNVDFPGNDLMCEMYTTSTQGPEVCREKCFGDKKCVGYVNIHPNTNPVFPQGFCCAKHTMVDVMESKGVDAFLKMNMAPR